MKKNTSPLDLVTKRLSELIEEKEKIETEKTWLRHLLPEMRSVFFINCKLYKVLTGEDYPSIRSFQNI